MTSSVAEDTKEIQWGRGQLATCRQCVYHRRFSDGTKSSADMRRNRLVIRFSTCVLSNDDFETIRRPKLGRKERGGKGEGNPEAYACISRFL